MSTPTNRLTGITERKQTLTPRNGYALNVGHSEADGFDELYTLIGQNLRRIRRERGFSQTDLASAAGIGRTTLVNIETHGQRTSIAYYYLLAYLLDVSIYDLLPATMPGLESEET